MRKISFLVLGCFLLSCEGEVGSYGNNSNNTNNANNVACADFDNDTICDEHEGKAENRDSDFDGIPDWQDTDSDNDGIPDSVEAGDADTATPPWDSDSDGRPDFIDEDSDGNGISDAIEGTGDLDGDGIPDFADLDNDGDFLLDTLELGDFVGDPPDEDSDGIPNHNDVDSDGDGIGDKYETSADSDGDGIPNYLDNDSDNDGIPDFIEGQTGGDPTVSPVDSDDDGHADFVDSDSDNDGLPDGQEDVNHNGIVDAGESDPRNADTDNDGVSDLIEIAAGTDPQNGEDNPRNNGDFVFLEPYEEPQSPLEDVLNFSTAFQKLDLLFVEDVSGSMNAEMNDVRNSLADMLSDIVCEAGEDPSVTHCIPDVQTGLIIFGDGSNPYVLRKSIDDNNLIADPGPDAQCTYNILPTTASGGSEMPITAMQAGITGTCDTDSGRVGRACFRPGALHLMLLITDEDLNEDSQYVSSDPALGFQSAYDDLINGGVRVIVDFGAGSTSLRDAIFNPLMDAQSAGVDLVPELDLSSVDIPVCTSLGTNPFYNDHAMVEGGDASAGPALSCAVQAVGAYLPQDVEAIVLNDPGNVTVDGTPVNAPDAFIDYIEVYMVTGDATCPGGYNTIDTNGDTFHDKFEGILPGNPVCWKIHSKENLMVPPALEPQMFMATIEVYGEGGALLDSRDVYFLVPPHIEGPGVIGKK
ncbi:thrombospondin type 3 repeat-containing protein [Myxococcota bacterium]|nr:thrombospondin type 3 repeat-containing protein [Myxococcota bacterium]MBU1537622.1 thrombospondin type 3 repeat-containing protein [Myxococcota bacterium]